MDSSGFSTQKKIGLMGGVAAFAIMLMLPTPEGMSPEGQRAADQVWFLERADHPALSQAGELLEAIDHPGQRRETVRGLRAVHRLGLRGQRSATQRLATVFRGSRAVIGRHRER